MTEKTASPFAGLDTALLRETQSKAGSEAAAERRRPARSQRAAEPAPAPPEEPADPIAAMQHALRTIGKEIYYIRVTPAEKRRIDDLAHALKQQGIRTSANEIGRIALNHLLADFDAHGDQSVLARVLEAKRP
jgi:hypothetical protein